MKTITEDFDNGLSGFAIVPPSGYEVQYCSCGDVVGYCNCND